MTIIDKTMNYPLKERGEQSFQLFTPDLNYGAVSNSIV